MVNPYAQQARQYKQNQIETASPEQILIMLYDGAIRFLTQAKRAMENGDLAKSHEENVRAQRIITELMTSLNLDVGGEVAQNLHRLYDYFLYRLVEANVQKDTAKIDEVLDHLRQLKETWVTAIDIAKREAKTAPMAEEAGEGVHA